MTFWNRSILLAACVAGASLTTLAQTTIVENSDAVGRHPFHANNDGSAAGKLSLNVPLATVPAGSRLVLEHVSANVLVPTAALLVCNIGNKAYPSVHHWLTFSASPGVGVDGSQTLLRMYNISQPISIVFNSLDEIGFNCYNLQTGYLASFSRIDAKIAISGRLMEGFRIDGSR